MSSAVSLPVVMVFDGSPDCSQGWDPSTGIRQWTAVVPAPARSAGVAVPRDSGDSGGRDPEESARRGAFDRELR
jgi:hypothetical protein